jgi:hypothetical protein
MFPQTRGFSKLAPWKTKKAEAYVRTLSLDVGYQASTRLGDVQGLLSTVTDARTGDILSANIEEAFAAGVEEALTKLSVNATLEQYFETSVARINLRLSRLLGENGLPIEPSAVQGAIVAQKGRDVAAAVWGRPSLLLFRQVAQGGSRFYDVLEDDGQGGNAHTRGFTNLITGKVSGKDRMIVANKNILELLEEHAVKEILSAPKTETATMLLRDALLAKHEDLSLALLLLDGVPMSDTVSQNPPVNVKGRRPVAPAQPIPISKPAPPRTDTVIDKGVDRSPSASITERPSSPDRAKMTAAIMKNMKGSSAQLGKMMGKAAGQTASIVGKAATTAKTRIEAARSEKESVTAEPAPILSRGLDPATVNEPVAAGLDPATEKSQAAETPTKTLSEPSAQVSPAVTRVIRESVRAHEVTPEKDRRTPLHQGFGGQAEEPTFTTAPQTKQEKHLPKKMKKAPAAERIIDVWNTLNTKSRYLLIAAMVLVFLLNISLGALGWRKGQEKAIVNYEKTIASIQQQLDSAEASMIYRDEDRARKLLTEASAAIVALPSDTEDKMTAKAGLETAIASKFAELRRSIPLGTPEVLAAVATQAGTPELERLAYDGSAYWSVSSDGDVFRISDDGATQLMHSSETVSPEIFLGVRSGMLVGNKEDLTLVSSSGRASSMDMPLDDLEIDISDATTFGSRVYFLDSAHNRVLRFAAVEGGYGSHSFYVKDATDLSKGVSLAIDGYVFILNNDGSITRLLRGEKTNYLAGSVDPALINATLLRTPSDTDDLYVLDSTESRVVRFDKNGGALVAQYESEALDGASDFWVDQDARTIIALNGNQLLRFTWPEEE